MDNTERDKIIMATHDNVTTLLANEISRDKHCEIHSKQIAILFEGYNQIQRNTISIKVIAAAGSILFSGIIALIIKFAQ